ncbi:MAG: GMC family oxidoreductase [Rhodospirillales bacterium]|nr:GMC family oxidoreductase [Rhodospirillales bacterium]
MDRYDVVIVGSGFGGAVMACRLAEAGRRVLVLERGREWTPETYPRGPGDAWVWDNDDPAKNNGWIDMRRFPDMTVVQGAAVGGGSLIYANVSIEAKPFVFETGWPSEITYDRLKPHYDTVGEMLNVQELPDSQLTERFKLMREAANAAGHGERFQKVELAVTFDKSWHYGLDDATSDHHSKTWQNAHGKTQGTCVHCGNCDIGCQVSAKNTLDLNYLARARDCGAEIRANHLVRSLVPLDDDAYEIQFDRIENGDLVPGRVIGDRAVLAAGSLGSTELLLRCRDEHRTLRNLSSRLGHGWCSNGDFLTPALYSNRMISPTRGPTITCAIDFLDGSQEGNRFFVEDGGFPDVIGNSWQDVTQTIASGAGQLATMFTRMGELAEDSDPLSCVMPWFGQAVDAPDGQMTLGRPWWNPFAKRSLRLDWDVSRSEAVVSAMIAMHKELSEKTGGFPVEPLSWQLFRDLVTPHPLGGCCMSDDPASGVVDANGRVFGHPNLYVVDGAIMPRAIGLNPSRTIAALAEHVAEQMVINWDVH